MSQYIHQSSDNQNKSTVLDFDPDQAPDSEHNHLAAAVRGLRYDQRRGQYLDQDDFPVRDRTGKSY
jgi:hypothetical protein